MASTIGPARQALYALLVEEFDNDEDILVSFGLPDREKATVVALLGVSTPTESSANIGPEAARDELFGLEVAVKYADAGANVEDHAAEIDAATFAAADRVRDVIRTHGTLNRSVKWAAVSSTRSSGTGRPADEKATGVLCLIEMTIACRSRAR